MSLLLLWYKIKNKIIRELKKIIILYLLVLKALKKLYLTKAMKTFYQDLCEVEG